MAVKHSNFQYFLSFAPIWLFLKLAGLLPFKTRVRLGGFLISSFMRRIPPVRNRVLKNLELVWPGTSREDGLKLCAGVGAKLGRTITEILFAEEFQTHHGALRPSGPGLQYILDAHEAGKPAIIVSGHFGQWDAARIYLRKEHGISVGGIYRPNSNPYYDPYFVKGTAASGEPLVPRNNEGIRTLVKHLKAGGTFAFLADQVFYRGRRLPFLGEEALTTMSPAELALRYKAPLVPAYGVRRDEEDAFDLIFEEPIPHSDPETMMRAFNDSASRMIEKHPDQWLWLHRRWK